MSMDAAIFADIFSAEGVSTILWEVSTRCSCYSGDTEQPMWGCPLCGGYGTIFADPQTVKGLFRGQSRWVSPRRQGELDHGEASITFPLTIKPGYTDRRVRDRFTVVNATGDAAAGRVFYAAAPPVPFLFGDTQYAWRVQLQSVEQSDRVVPQP